MEDARTTPPSLPDVPDFDTYPITQLPVSARAEARAVVVDWDDGLQSRFHVMTLREHAPDPQTTHPVTREQTYQLFDIPADLTAVAAWVEAGGVLAVRWSEGDESRYHPGWLRTYAPETPDTLFAMPERVTWTARSLGRIPRFDGPAALQDPAVFLRWLESLHIHGVAILENLPATPDIIEAVPGRIGALRDSNFGRIFNVETRPDADSNAYTALGLPLHVDLATREYMPGLQFLHCLTNDADGGESQLADGFRVAKHIQATDPEAFELLTTVPLTFCTKAIPTDHRWQAPLIVLGADGEPDEIRWTPWLRGPLKLPFETLERLYRALRTFEAVQSDQFCLTEKLVAGDLLGFDNRRVLHGRTAFDPSSGKRWLRGCYIEREELHSAWRMARRRARAAAAVG